ncbi:Periplasmic pH-dependent serine endoprotease DegQ [Candidatus Steffania adelgidicola]|nr:Periplasmic pH-dependent serine endoprotease DegQ [Candidatus Steffania adelgidicola]
MKTTPLFRVLALSIGLNLLLFLGVKAALPIKIEGQSIPSLAPILTTVLPAVVSIHVKGSQSILRPILPKEFRYFFGDIPRNNSEIHQFEELGLGSGVIINAEDGYVITNNHVVNHADKITIQLNDGRIFKAKLIGRDEPTDLALLQLPSLKNLKEIKIADSDALKVGDFVIAVGNPFGLGQTVTSGIISALGRRGLHLESLENFIQTDASMNRGNSGGALVNLNGELIGINTAILAPGGGNIGIGFAIPSNIVKNLSQQIIKYGEVKRGQLGIKGAELTADIAKVFNIETDQGAFISEVLPHSAAEKACIKSGDVIISVENKPIQSFAELRVKLATSTPGQTMKLGLLRNGKSQIIPVILDDSTSTVSSNGMITPALQGASLRNTYLTDGRQGIRVEEVLKNSPAAEIGLQQDDVIIGINRERIQSISQFRKILEKKPVIIALNIVRGNSNIFILLR